MNVTQPNTIRFAAVGDLLLTAESGGSAARGLEALGDDVRELFASCDLVFANLECTLGGAERVPTEPLVLSTEKQIQSLRNSGINIVTLGNNHAFDCFDEGYQKLADILSNLSVPWCGAGFNYEEASRPVIVERNGITVAFIGVVDASSGPYRFATDSASGVAPLDVEGVCQSIRDIREKVDHVIVSPHWGMERFRIPSLQQIDQAHAFVDAGATMVLGHHPHVMQGMELYRRAPILYSLGNFLANQVYWSSGDHLTWSRFERTGVILLAEFSSDNVCNIRQIPVYDDGATIFIDSSGQGASYIKKANSLLAKGVSAESYKREKFYVQSLKPVIAQLRWKKLKRIRPGHIKKLLRLFSQ